MNKTEAIYLLLVFGVPLVAAMALFLADRFMTALMGLVR
jgi:hypothetical protein